MTISLTRLLEQVPTTVEGRVKAARDRSRSVLREALRADSRLSMRGPGEVDERGAGAQVPIEVVPGHPAVLNSVDFPDDLQQVLLLSRYRRPLAEVAAGTKELLNLHTALGRLADTESWAPSVDHSLRETRGWALSMLERLEAHDPVGSVLGVNEDVLGVYVFDPDCGNEFSVNKATIRLYWCVIGLVSDWLGCSVEDLTIVVLTHELAHAYTQLGTDIEGRRWPSRQFAFSEVGLKEGLAQYYTVRALERLRGRFPGALACFVALLSKQSPPYHQHEPWRGTYSPEAVRRAMIEVRRWGEGRVDQFEARLARAAEEFKPLSDELFEG